MKTMIIVVLFFMVCFQFACSMGGKSFNQSRDISKMFFMATIDKGIFKTQSCKEYEKDVCKSWDIKFLNSMDDKDWNFIKNNRMILVNENMFFDID